MSVQYRSSGGTAAATGVTPLSGTVPAGGYYLVQQGAGAGGTEALPTPDATGTINMSGSAFTVWLAQGTTALNPGTGSVTSAPGVVDLLGVNGNTFETTRTGGLSNATSASRTSPDGDVNVAEFTIGAPDPRNSSSTGGGTDPQPQEATIAEIQGDGFTSPLVGSEVVTSGVVTAVPRFLYGFYLQTPGTGGEGTRTSSDGVFVYFPQGSGSIAVEPGDHVQVTGDVAEYAGQTQVVSSQAEVVELSEPAEPVTAYAGAWPASDAEKEALEGMLFDPTGERFTVTNTYSTNQYGEVGLALGDTPLIQPTEVADAQDLAEHRPGPGGCRGDLHRAGGADPGRLAQQPDVPLPADHLGERPGLHHDRAGGLREHPHRGSRGGRGRPERGVVQRAQLLHHAR